MKLDVQIPPIYPPNCRVVFCGDTPDTAGGQAERVLQKMAYAGGLQWDQVGRTSVVKRVLDGWYDSKRFKSIFYETTKDGKKKVIQPTSELADWIKCLRDELERTRPTVVVACGNESLKALCGTEGIVKHRGSVLASTLVPGLWVVPLIHPRDIFDPHLGKLNCQELYISGEVVARKVAPIANGSWTNYLSWKQQTAPTIDDWNKFTEEIDGPFSLDIETRGDGIACVGVAWASGVGDVAMCVPIQTTRGPYFDNSRDEWEFWRGLQRLCERQILVGHNLFFDYDWLRDYGIQPTNVVDTMLLFHRYYPELPKSLAFVSMWLTDISYYKDDGQTWGYRQPDQRLWDYNLKDCIATLRVYRALMAMNSTKRRLYDTHTTPLLPIAFEMQILGMDADVVGVDFARIVLTSELEKIRTKLADLSDGKLVTREGNKKITDKQVADYLYGDLGLPVKRNRKTKAVTADEDALTDLLIQFPDMEVLKAINSERKFGKALNSYINIRWKN